MPVTRLAPDGVTLTNLSGSLADIQDDPDDPAGMGWLVATATNVQTTAHCTFPTPADALTPGAGLQEIRVKVRQFLATQSGIPSARIEVFEGGVQRFVGPTVSVTDPIGQVFALRFDGSGMVGANVDVRVVGLASGGGPTARNSVDIGAVEWNADTTAPPPAPTVVLFAAFGVPL